MNLVSFDSVTLSLGEGSLFSSVSLGVEEGERIGFVGPNGAGKSSFLRLLTGELVPDLGSIARKRGLVINVLDQMPHWEAGDSIRDFLFRSADPLVSLVGRYEACLADPDGPGGKDFERFSHEMEEKGGFEIERRFSSFLSELGIDDLSLPMDSLSGGMAKKAALARCLGPDADLYLLDEPTNHLDVDSIEWLERKLVASGKAFILVTHDRWFLDSVCNVMMDLDGGQVRKYIGGYSDYLARRAERAAEAERHEERREAILRVEMAWLARGPKARAGKDKKRVANAAELAAGRPDAPTLGSEAFRTGSRRLGGKVLEMRGASKAFGSKKVLDPFDWTLSKGQRIGVVGPNGSGKTTLLDLIAGRLESDSGTVERGETVSIAYFDQHASAARRDAEALDFVKEVAERVRFEDGTELSAEQFLERFGFPRSMFRQDLSSLSGGELRRLALVRLLIGSPNLILFDEPTNDFDIPTIALLEDFLDRFDGCVIVVSHDRAFLERVVDTLLVLDGEGGVEPYVGAYATWREQWKDAKAAAQSAEAQSRVNEPASLGSSSGAAPVAPPRRKGLSFKENREFEGLLPRIEALEEEKGALERGFADPQASLARDAEAMAKARRRYGEIDGEVETLTQRWEELAERA